MTSSLTTLPTSTLANLNMPSPNSNSNDMIYLLEHDSDVISLPNDFSQIDIDFLDHLSRDHDNNDCDEREEAVNESSLNSVEVLNEISDRKQMPAAFSEMGDMHEICSWIADHPVILEKANEIFKLKNIKINDIDKLAHPHNHKATTPGIAIEMSSSSFPSLINNTHMDKLRLWDEELKCLFLRTRFPSQTTIDYLIKNIFSSESYTDHAKAFDSKAKSSFGDYRNKYKKCITNLVTLLKNKKERGHESQSLTSADVIAFVDESVIVNKALKRFISATNKLELKNNGSLKNLILFVQRTFTIAYKGDDIDLKSLENITKNIVIPSRSGTNLISKIVVGYIYVYIILI
jgi:hypothetical protein